MRRSHAAGQPDSRSHAVRVGAGPGGIGLVKRDAGDCPQRRIETDIVEIFRRCWHLIAVGIGSDASKEERKCHSWILSLGSGLRNIRNGSSNITSWNAARTA